MSTMRCISRTQRFSSGSEALALFIGLSNATSRRVQLCTPCRFKSTSTPPSLFEIEGESYPKDNWFNLPTNITSSLTRRLHIQPDHPISITRSIIESIFPSPTYKYHNNFFPIVTTHQNFDSLGFPLDHPGRSKTDTYYLNSKTCLRTHTSAHQADTFAANTSNGFLISADVYRRDAIDRSHYPIFHQMEGARTWSRNEYNNDPDKISKAIYADLEKLPKHKMKVEDPNPTTHPERNPLQPEHSPTETEAIAAHLKRSLELVVNEIFTRAALASSSPGSQAVGKQEQLRVRWIEAYFPFTSPSWELEIYWQNEWLEVLGCGVIRQSILTNAGVEDRIGWAFGMGLERLAMLLFEIPDIRLFWSQDERFLGQFRGVSDDWDKMKKFVPFSKYPECYKDVSFFLPEVEEPIVPSGSDAGGLSTSTSSPSPSNLGTKTTFHENDVMEIVRDTAGDLVEDVRLTDSYTNPKTGRKSVCYRINYRSLERTLTNKEVNGLHDKVTGRLVGELGVVLR